MASLESTIFTYEGGEFVRTHTTLLTEDGKPAINTKLDHDNPSYKALTEKRSFSGQVTLFGKQCDANYAPLIDSNRQLTGAFGVFLFG